MLTLAGCGSRHGTPTPPPTLPRAVAQPLAARADRVAALLAAGNRCGAVDEAVALRAAVTTAINARRVPNAFQEPLSSSANGLVASVGACVRPQLAEPDGNGPGGDHGDQGDQGDDGKHRGRDKHGGDGGG